MKCEYYKHMLAPDSKSLMNSLRAEDVDLSSMVLLKTVILQGKNLKDSSESNWVYAILPYDKEVVFDQTKYELVPEKSILKKFNQGIISPLTVFEEASNDLKQKSNIYILNKDRINTKYVIMRSESNHESIRMKCEDFYCIAEKVGSRMESIIE